ncbi:MAG: hypothetical protein E7376_04710 [Clostridiales bacterium]|nr:hypothetical protein [Clostridiales bacterium]
MLVYRRLSKSEFLNIKTGLKCHLGTECSKSKLANNHKYKKGVKYLHFFKNKGDVYRIRQYQTKPVPYYICTFNIPNKILEKCKGRGKYDAGGYDYATTWVTEYAINVDDFDCNWLIEHEIDNYLCKTQNER